MSKSRGTKGVRARGLLRVLNSRLSGAASPRAPSLSQLFKDPEDFDEDDEITANRYSFKFSDIAPRSDHKALWIKVGDVLDLDTPERLVAYRDTLNAVYNVANFTTHAMAVIRQNWDLIRRSLEGAVVLAARFGLDSSSLTSMNTLIPIAYYLSRLSESPLDGTLLFNATQGQGHQILRGYV